MSQTMLEYFEKYRQKKNDMESINALVQDSRKQLNDLQIQLNQLSIEISGMQRVISTAIDKDIDPAEVVIRFDLSERSNNLWDEPMIEVDENARSWYPATLQASQLNKPLKNYTSGGILPQDTI